MRTLLTSACVAAAAAAVLLTAPSAYADGAVNREDCATTVTQSSRRPSPDCGRAGLAETGSSTPVGALVAAAALLLGAGVYLTLRHRESCTRRH